jgi:MAF protein
VSPFDQIEGGARLVLASASPRRRALLGLLGVPFSVAATDVDERPRPGEAPEALASRLARTKALAIRPRAATPPGAAEAERGDAIVLAADTIVVLDGAILGKPRDGAEAASMLQALRARPHRVLSGLALAVRGTVAWSSVVETTVWMRAYRDDEIARYVASGRPLDKAGGYGIQDADFRPVERIDGCYANVVGLPLCEVRRALAAVSSSGPRAEAEVLAPDSCRLCERARALSGSRHEDQGSAASRGWAAAERAAGPYDPS